MAAESSRAQGGWRFRGHPVHSLSVVPAEPRGPALLLVHGFGASTDHWRFNIPVLARDHEVHALDLLGFGRSAKPAGLAWLACPVPPAAIVRHLERDASLPSLAFVVPAAAALLAGLGLLPAVTLLLAACGAAALTWLTRRVACAGVVSLVAGRGSEPSRDDGSWRALLRASHATRSRAVTPARLRRESRADAIARLDRAITGRAPNARARLVGAIVVLIVAIAAWGLTGRPAAETRAVAFGAFLVCMAQLGAWAAWRAASDPRTLWSPLPLSLGDRWRARAKVLALAIIGALVVVFATAGALPLVARLALAFVWGVPATVIALIGLHLGLASPEQPGVAENAHLGWLGVAVLASLTIPLLGWGMLAGALVFATRRMARTAREEAW